MDIERIMQLPGAARSMKKALDKALDSTDYSFCLATLLLSGQGGVLIQALFCDIGGDRMVHGYRDKVSLQSLDKVITRFKLEGTISTNGLVLNLLAYDTTQTKRQRTTVGCDSDIVNALAFSSMDPHNPNLWQTVKVRGRFLYLPVLRFNHPLNKRNREKEMIEIESAIPVIERNTYNEYFQWVNEESQTQTGSTNLDVL
ncbi:hypothetical protein BCR41DRAFT_394173 [Lobosporangium transversale]|uniref:Uncharacterized protein n=1 Tax=Lobosporangium transversale TaxID=64571 RepID=A0A1Y2GUF4_9FUNG|nr:hypothetical protein BCR41DRAFT_394173 [Lobosporangium transversale]ORZ23856.1 hypothetical protein BCR41DRAFT_394173 [Lobosporangium transversale]|eukprot:XP_021883670.1 hypothetical protein BCR41DRAFT_394173 [Lobosporangium transversale]